jgi:hypothetical protein
MIAVSPPTPAQQLERAHRLWPDKRLSEPPAYYRSLFMPEYNNPSAPQVKWLLLVVPDSPESLPNKLVPPEGYRKSFDPDFIRFDSSTLRLAPNTIDYGDQPTWVVFDPEYGRGVPPETLWNTGEVHPAGMEVFSALVQFPQWALTWYNGASTPNAWGYKFYVDLEDDDEEGNWSNTLMFDRMPDDSRTFQHLTLDGRWAGYGDDRVSCPSVKIA